jgi:hypothetical protein
MVGFVCEPRSCDVICNATRGRSRACAQPSNKTNIVGNRRVKPLGKGAVKESVALGRWLFGGP